LIDINRRGDSEDGGAAQAAWVRTVGQPPVRSSGRGAANAAHLGLAEEIRRGRLLRLESVRQDRGREIRYTRNAEFTDEVAGRYLERGLTAVDVERMLAQAPARDFVAPFFA
jgi:hypothetical protein